MRVEIQLLSQEARLPEKMSTHAAGYDLFAALKENIILLPQSVQLISTGISIALPSGFEAQIRPRSGLAYKHGIGILNSPGTIDSDYRGEVKVILYNFSDREFVIENGMRIAQMVIAQYEEVEFQRVELLEITERGKGGFGHTGV
ncbi:MAG: dUTP diphosphatase [Candidatus Cloacimonetes bacterium]|nr:dUTP diphosphatase [Candidatus Cloacimonadota bacterium]